MFRFSERIAWPLGFCRHVIDFETGTKSAGVDDSRNHKHLLTLYLNLEVNLKSIKDLRFREIYLTSSSEWDILLIPGFCDEGTASQIPH